MKKGTLLFGIFLFTIGLCGCTASKSSGPLLMSSIRPALPGTKAHDLSISSVELSQALSRSELVRKLRMIQLYKSVAEFETEIPEYRLFGITEGSPYALLGLQNADVLVAANDYIVRSPVAFVQYLGLLPNEKSAFIEVRREGEPLILKYKIR